MLVLLHDINSKGVYCQMRTGLTTEMICCCGIGPKYLASKEFGSFFVMRMTSLALRRVLLACQMGSALLRGSCLNGLLLG